METKLLNLLQEFSYNLQEISPRKIENMEIILPYDSFKQLEYELSSFSGYSFNMTNLTNNKIKVNSQAGIAFEISCKEVNDGLIQKKLRQCFKILSE